MAFDTFAGTAVERRLRSIAAEVAEFANAEATASGLPGRVNGPQDAYRHLVGVGELARRVGVVPAWLMAEYNELESRAAMRRAEQARRPVPAANTRESRSMDRHNNRLALGLGLSAASPEQVIQRARIAIDRAHRTFSGSGADGTAFWHPHAMWEDIGGDAAHLPTEIRWPPPGEHLKAYERALATGTRSHGGRGAGSVFVSDHLREGQPVAGYWRSAPSP
jgi:hypothetical protein